MNRKCMYDVCVCVMCIQLLSFLFFFCSSLLFPFSCSVAGLYLYTLVVATFSGDNMRFKMYAFIGWGEFIFVFWIRISYCVVLFYLLPLLCMECLESGSCYIHHFLHFAHVQCTYYNNKFESRFIYFSIPFSCNCCAPYTAHHMLHSEMK